MLNVVLRQSSRLPAGAWVVLFGLCTACADEHQGSIGTRRASFAPAPARIELVSVANHPRWTHLRFGVAANVTWANDSTVVLIDEGEQQIVLADVKNGTAVRMGGRGRGPGQFVDVVGALAREDGVVAVDAAARRLNRFSTQGRLLGGFEIAGRPIRLLGWSGESVVGLWVAPVGAAFEPVVGAIDLRTGVVSEHFRIFEVDSELDYRLPGTAVSFGAIAAARRASGITAVAEVHQYRILAVDADGRIRAVFARENARPLRYTQDELSSLMVTLAETADAAGPSASAARHAGRIVLQGLREATKPFFSQHGLEWDDTGRLWVVTKLPGRDSTTVDVFDASSAAVRSLRLAGTVRALAIRREQVAALVRREPGPDAGVDGIDLFRIVETPPARQ